MYYKDINYGKMLLHIHDFIEIILVMEGEVSISHEGILYNMNSGDISIVPNGLFHNTIIHKNTKKYERYVLHVDRKLLEEMIDANLAIKFDHTKVQAPLVVNCDAEDTFYIRFILNQISHNNIINDEFSPQIIHKAVYEIFIFLERKFRIPKTSGPKLSNKLVSDVIEYINNNFTSSEINVRDIAYYFFVSEGYLSKLFRKFTGTTVYNYIIEKRLSYTRELIANGAPIQEACYSSGFRDYTSYLKSFKKKYDITPTEFKENKDNLLF